ncbi:MAG: hypothetical protein PF483_05360 [Halothiobacillus sp.]|nr:hypothetical protein [Halothiobacillus sp.]
MNALSNIPDAPQIIHDLQMAVDNLSEHHRKLATLIATPNEAESADVQLDDIVLAIKSGNEQLEAAETHRQQWVTHQAPGMDMVVALKRIDHANQSQLLDEWLKLQPRIEVLHGLMQRHQLVVDRLAQFMQERVNILTQSIAPTDTSLYASSGKTAPSSGRQRSLGDA